MSLTNQSPDYKFALDVRLLNDHSGIARYSSALIKFYLKVLPKKVKILLITNDAELLRNNFPNLEVIETDLLPFNLIHFVKFDRLLTRHNVTHYHSFFYSTHFFKPRGIKTIVTVHDLMYRLIPGFFGPNRLWNWFARIYYNIIVSRSIKTADLVLACSETSKQDIYNWLETDCLKVRNGIDTEIFEKQRYHQLSSSTKELLENLRVFTDGFILYVGNRRMHKNLELLVDCYQNSGTEKFLILCGVSIQSGTMALSNFQNLPKKVICLERVSDEDLFWMYENCAAFVFPSKYEGFGLPILEASLLGAPVISSNAGALKEFDDLNVHFFDPNDGHALTDFINRIDMIKKDAGTPGIVRSRYTWDKTLAPLLTGLKSLCPFL